MKNDMISPVGEQTTEVQEVTEPKNKFEEVKEIKTKLVEKKYVLSVITVEGYHPYPKEIRNQMEDFRRISSEIITINGIPTRDILTGLTRDQEEVLVQFHSMIGSDPKSDRNFRTKVSDFWKEFTFRVPVGKRIELNASYTVEKSMINGYEKEVAIPVNIEDFIKVHFCLGHSKVSKNREEINSVTHTCLIEDLSEVKQKSLASLAEANEADTNYVKLLSSGEKIDWMVSKLESSTENLSNYTKEEKLLYLREKKSSSMEEFNKEFNNPNLKEEAFVLECTKEGILTLEDGEYSFDEKPLGSLKETVKYLLVPTNTTMYDRMRKQLNEAKIRK